MNLKKDLPLRKQKIKALLLFSGGLDSILSAKILKEQKIEVVALFLKSYFFDEEEAKKIAKRINVPLRVIDFSKKHLKVLMNPKHGYGSAINPCIDCHKLMLKEANKIKGFDFIATGEVLGQRPMSQTKRAITLIEKELNMEGKILRPLSAKLLKETFAEKKGFIKREKLFGFEGKSRKGQMKIAKEFHLKEYPSPCGGCILTEKEFAKKLKELFKLWREKRFKNDIELLKVGRHFRLNLAKIVIGRNEKENKKMEKIALKGDILIKMKNYQGPLTLVRFYEKRNEEIIKEAKKLTKYYSTKSRNKKDVLFEVKS